MEVQRGAGDSVAEKGSRQLSAFHGAVKKGGEPLHIVKRPRNDQSVPPKDDPNTETEKGTERDIETLPPDNSAAR